MAFQEFTALLPVERGNRRVSLEFNLHVDVNTCDCTDIYTERDNYEKMPIGLKKLVWDAQKNPLFIHVLDTQLHLAWEYLRDHAILDDELEELLA